MATHHGKEGVVTIGGTTLGNATGFTVDTTHDVVEDTALGDSMKSYLVGRGTYTFTISGDRKFSGTGIVTGMSVGVTLDGVTTRTVSGQGNGGLTIGTV